MEEQITNIRQEVEEYTINNEEELEAFRLKFLSRKGRIQEMFGQMGSVPKEDRAKIGKMMNEVKELAQQKFDDTKKALSSQQSEDIGATDDITLPAPEYPLGSLHPLTRVLNDMKDIFLRMGFSISHGPELEDDFHNFTALNFPPNHPARDTQDTFYVNKSEKGFQDDLVLRTHTSPVQIRLMEKQAPPIRAIIPGRVYRNEAITYKSNCLFHQLEGLYVDEHVSIADLKKTLINFAKLMYGKDVKYRLRPGYFPFTEPSLEMDVWSEPKQEWMEIMGSGMVDPNVFESVSVDTEKYSGYAFGMGIERIAMLKYQIDDIRLFSENDIRFLKQFG